jgi:hypothetical protein
MVKKTENYEDWLNEFVDKFNTVMINTATVNNAVLKFAEQLDTVYIMVGALKIATSRLLEKEVDIPKADFDKMFNTVYKELMSGKTDLQNEYLISVKELLDKHHDLVEMIESFRNTPTIAKA